MRTYANYESWLKGLNRPARWSGAAGLAAALLGSAAASAQTPAPSAPATAPVYSIDPGLNTGFYLGGDAGASFMKDFSSSRYGFPGRFSTDTGWRIGVEPGYNVFADEWVTLGAEFETGIIDNRISSVLNAGAATPLDGHYVQVPVLGNLVARFNTHTLVCPYAGIGGGGDYSSARLPNAGYYGYPYSNDGEFDPAVQAKAGVNFRITPSADVGLEYKFLAALPGDGRYIGEHALEAAFTFKF